mmetsp:Transcript_48051/g.77524  ORF Transcript_48051/g.77524 Transcript_48051/m.77524 type:complete len:138 (-) Transcript_48051:218-631(-)
MRHTFGTSQGRPRIANTVLSQVGRTVAEIRCVCVCVCVDGEDSLGPAVLGMKFRDGDASLPAGSWSSMDDSPLSGGGRGGVGVGGAVRRDSTIALACVLTRCWPMASIRCRTNGKASVNSSKSCLYSINSSTSEDSV